MAKFYYTTSEKSETGKSLALFFKECRKAETAAELYAKRMGAQEFIYSQQGFTGGVSGLIFAEPDKFNNERWKEVDTLEDGTRVFLPNVVTLLKKGVNGKVVVQFDVPDKKAKVVPLDGKRANNLHKRKKAKHSNAFLSAVRAERERMNLPVVPISKLVAILGLRQIKDPDEKVRRPMVNAPQFFLHDGEYVVACDEPSTAKDMQLIEQGRYVYLVNCWKQKNGLQ